MLVVFFPSAILMQHFMGVGRSVLEESIFMRRAINNETFIMVNRPLKKQMALFCSEWGDIATAKVLHSQSTVHDMGTRTVQWLATAPFLLLETRRAFTWTCRERKRGTLLQRNNTGKKIKQIVRNVQFGSGSPWRTENPTGMTSVYGHLRFFGVWMSFLIWSPLNRNG